MRFHYQPQAISCIATFLNILVIHWHDDGFIRSRNLQRSVVRKRNLFISKGDLCLLGENSFHFYRKT